MQSRRLLADTVVLLRTLVRARRIVYVCKIPASHPALDYVLNEVGMGYMLVEESYGTNPAWVWEQPTCPFVFHRVGTRSTEERRVQTEPAVSSIGMPPHAHTPLGLSAPVPPRIIGPRGWCTWGVLVRTAVPTLLGVWYRSFWRTKSKPPFFFTRLAPYISPLVLVVSRRHIHTPTRRY